jgi:hypothetical protein
VLIVGHDEENSVVTELKGLVPTVRFVTVNDLSVKIRQGDWDAAVLLNVDAELERHLFVLQFGGNKAEVLVMNRRCRVLVIDGEPSVATELAIPPDTPKEVARLVRSELVPTAMEEEFKPTIDLLVLSRLSTDDVSLPVVTDVVEAFLMDLDKKPIAGRYLRGDDGISEWWRIPVFVQHPERGLAVALQLWRERDSIRFPSQAAWEGDRNWQTDEEISVAAERERLEAEREDAERRFAEELAELEVRQQAAIQQAD